MTGKQMAFCRAIASGLCTQTQAYTEAYDCENMSIQSQRVESSRLLTNPKITLCIGKLKASMEAHRQAQSLTDRDRVLAKLRTWIDSADPTDSNRLRAAELLGKSVGMFKDVTETVVQDRDADQIALALEQRLLELLGTSPEQVTEPVVKPDGQVH